MIFVTVGTQAPFNRLIRAMDSWAAAHPTQAVVAQIGPSRVPYQSLEGRCWMSGTEFVDAMRNSRLVVAHAGIGTILTALRLEVPVLVMPRKAQLGEHRDDHQMETARRLESLGVVSVAWDESKLSDRIEVLLAGGAKTYRGASTREAVIAAVRAAVLDAVRPATQSRAS